MDPTYWPVLLTLGALLLIALEIFIPSGGFLSVMAIVCIVSSVVTAFFVSLRYGVIVMTVNAILIPTMIALGVRWWPRTPIGRRMLGFQEEPDDVLPENERYRGLQRLIGKRGKSKTTMLPGGVVVIDDKSYDAVTEGMAIEEGEPIEVVQVRLQRLVVKPANAFPAEEEPADADDLMSRPIDSFGLDDLEDPLA